MVPKHNFPAIIPNKNVIAEVGGYMYDWERELSLPYRRLASNSNAKPQLGKVKSCDGEPTDPIYGVWNDGDTQKIPGITIEHLSKQKTITAPKAKTTPAAKVGPMEKMKT